MVESEAGEALRPPEPGESSPIERRLRRSTMPRNKNLSVQVDVARVDQGQEILRITVSNSTGAEWDISEADVRLECGTAKGEPTWGLSPRWRSAAADRFPVITIPSGETGQLDIDWGAWVRQGLWYHRSGPQAITGPTLTDPQPGKISVRAWVATFGAIPVETAHPRVVAPPAMPAARPAQHELLEMLVRGGKLETKVVNAAVVLVADRAAQDAEFARLVLDELDKSCSVGERTSQAQRHLLSVVTEMFDAWSSRRWRTQFASHYPEDLLQVVPPHPGAALESAALTTVLRHGRGADRSDICDFALAARALHHPDARPFLRDLMLNPESTSPFEQPTPAPGAAGKWQDNIGGAWHDAKFVAAVGLAEQGDVEGIQWLLDYARPNEFGIAVSLWRASHLLDRTGSIQESGRLALCDLFELPSSTTPAQLADWWSANREQLIASPVRLKPGN